MAQVVVRKLDDGLVHLIDQKAKEKKLSREKFLRNYLNLIDDSSMVKQEVTKMENMLERLEKGVAINHERLKSLDKNCDRLLHLLIFALNVPPENMGGVTDENKSEKSLEEIIGKKIEEQRRIKIE